MTKHRMTEIVFETIRYISEKNSRGIGRTVVHAGEIREHLQEEMDNPPSDTTITRILSQLAEEDLLRHAPNRSDWFLTDLANYMESAFYRYEREQEKDKF